MKQYVILRYGLCGPTSLTNIYVTHIQIMINDDNNNVVSCDRV